MSLDASNRRLDTSDKKVNALEDTVIKATQN